MIRRLKLAYKIFRKRRADARLQNAINLIAKVPMGLDLLKIAGRCNYRIFVDTRMTKKDADAKRNIQEGTLRLRNTSLAKMINGIVHELRHVWQDLFLPHTHYADPAANMVLLRAMEGDAFAFADTLCAEITAATGVKTHNVLGRGKIMRDAFYAFQNSGMSLMYDQDALVMAGVVEPEDIKTIFNQKIRYKSLPDMSKILVPGLNPREASYIGHKDAGLKKALLSYAFESLRPYYQ